MKFRAITFNLHKGFGYFNLKYNLERIKSLLMSVDPDIVFLQELHSQHPKTHESIQSPLEDLADSYWPHYKHGINAIYSGNSHGNAILSKYHIEVSSNIDISTNRLEQRGLLHAQVHVDAQVLDLYCTHLNLLPKGQAIQCERIAEIIFSEARHHPVILAGDFNDWSRIVRKKMIKKYNMRAIPKYRTYPSTAPLLPVDTFFYQNIRLVKSQVLKNKQFLRISDHLPVVSEFEITR